MVHLKNNFSKATDADAEMVWNDIRGVEFDDAHRAIIEHRREKGSQAWRPDPRRIKYLAYAALNDRRRAKSSELKIVDFIRRGDPANPTPSDYSSVSDRDAITDHFSAAWAAVATRIPDGSGDISPAGTVIARAYILNHCRVALTEIRMGLDDADTLARECVDLKKGQRIPSAGVFRKVPSASGEEFKSFDAITRLAYAVRDQESVIDGSGI